MLIPGVVCVLLQQGDWGTLHAKRGTDWAQHLKSPRNYESLASILFRWHGADRLEGRRRDPAVGGPVLSDPVLEL